MNIGISTSVIQRGRGGVGQHLLHLVHALLKYSKGHHFTLFVLADDLPIFEFARSKMTIVPVSERFRPPIHDILWHQLVLPRLVRKYQLDVIHVPSYRRMPWKVPCAAVATIHDLAAYHVPGKYDMARMFYGRTVSRALARRQNKIITVSEATAQDAMRFFNLPARRIRVIHNGVDHRRFSPGSHKEARGLLAEHYGLNRPFFLYVARLEHPAKNHVRLIEAFENFKAATDSPWQLVLAGSDWHGAEVIYEKLRKSTCSADVRCLGFVPDDELPTLYRGAEVFVYPSLFEGFGMPPIEAMACGCPVLAARCPALDEVLGSAAATADPKDVHAMAEQMELLAGNAFLREQWRIAGLKRARAFDWRLAAVETVDVYLEANDQVSRLSSRRVGIPAFTPPLTTNN